MEQDSRNSFIGDTTVWKHASDGRYSSASTYLIQFEAPAISFMKPVVWDNWAPPKCKFFLLG
jgi:hypothetical protein